MNSQPSNFRKKNQTEVNDDECGTYNTNSQSKFKSTMIKYYPILCDYIEGNRLVKETITITGAGAGEASRNT